MPDKKFIRVNFCRADSHMSVTSPQLDIREYDYFILKDGDKAKEGDYAVVNVSGTLKIVKIVKVVSRSVKATKYAITTFSLDAYNSAVERIAKIQDLKSDIITRAEDAAKRKKLEELAGSDPVLASMLEELKGLESEQDS